MHINGRVTVLTQEATFRIAGATLLLVVQIILDKEVILGMQLGLLVAGSVVGTSVRELHEALIAYADTLTPIVARVTSL